MAPLLIADIGGTNARFALFHQGVICDITPLRCADYPTITAAIQHYLGSSHQPRPSRAALAIAGPVTGDCVTMTNCPWQFSIKEVKNVLQLNRVRVINDFTALALAVRHLSTSDVMQVGRGSAIENKPIAILGPGTGLGVSGLIPADGSWVPLQGEGGHTTWSPSNEREIAVLQVLWKQYPHVSTERVLCGSGLVNLYQSLCVLDGVRAHELSPAEVTDHAQRGDNAHCLEAVDMFCGILGTAASNLAVTIGAAGGVYIAGGIIPKLGDLFQRSSFRARFETKGRFSDYLAAIPTWVITAPFPAFSGLAHVFDYTDVGVE